MEARLTIHQNDMRKLFAHLVNCIEHHDPDDTCGARCCNPNRGLLSFNLGEGFTLDYHFLHIDIDDIKAVRYITCSGKGIYLFTPDGQVQFSGRRNSFGRTELFQILIEPIIITLPNLEIPVLEAVGWTSTPDVPLGDLQLFPA